MKEQLVPATTWGSLRSTDKGFKKQWISYASRSEEALHICVVLKASTLETALMTGH